jgi:hypothetical protein
MALQSIPFERHVPPTDSSAATGFDNPLVENLFKKVQSVSQYQLQDIDARTVEYYGGSVESSTSKFADSGLLDKQVNSIFAIDVKKMIWNNLYELRRSELLGVETHEA